MTRLLFTTAARGQATEIVGYDNILTIYLAWMLGMI